MSAVRVLQSEREAVTHTVDGERRGPHAFITIEVDTGNGVLVVEVDAGDWSKSLATGVSSPATLRTRPFVRSA